MAQAYAKTSPLPRNHMLHERLHLPTTPSSALRPSSLLSQCHVCNARAPENLLNDLSALQELRVDTSRDSPGSQVYHTLPSIPPPISRLSILHTLKFEGGHSILNLDLLSRLNPVWAHLTNVAIELCEELVVIRLLQLTPNLCSLNICGISDDEIPLERESFTHTNIQSLSIAYRFGTYRCKRIYPRAYPLAPFLNALMLPNLRVLNIGERSWTGEELNAVGSVICPVQVIHGPGRPSYTEDAINKLGPNDLQRHINLEAKTGVCSQVYAEIRSNIPEKTSDSCKLPTGGRKHQLKPRGVDRTDELAYLALSAVSRDAMLEGTGSDEITSGNSSQRLPGKYEMDVSPANMGSMQVLVKYRVSVEKLFSLGIHLDKRLCRWGEEIAFLGRHRTELSLEWRDNESGSEDVEQMRPSWEAAQLCDRSVEGTMEETMDGTNAWMNGMNTCDGFLKPQNIKIDILAAKISCTTRFLPFESIWSIERLYRKTQHDGDEYLFPPQDP
ncbi:hypothetical protein EDB19DRAFT_2026038 [Suillus lakei]|nr:hypothetical protein EDB19DRAFT_2026038 [Suillus lakei]